MEDLYPIAVSFRFFVPNCGFSLSFSSFSEGTLSYNILKKVPKDTVRVGDDGLSGRAKNAPI